MGRVERGCGGNWEGKEHNEGKEAAGWVDLAVMGQAGSDPPFWQSPHPFLRLVLAKSLVQIQGDPLWRGRPTEV